MSETTDYRNRVGKVLDAVLAEIDVPPSKYEEATAHYKTVGDWLNAEDSEIAVFEPKIYAQGSFALGTVIKPLGEEDYDIDAVCRLEGTTEDFSQKSLKQAVGIRLKANETYKKMLNPPEGGRRCWTLKYADDSKFHLDILPSIPDSPTRLLEKGVDAAKAKHGILITDMKVWSKGGPWPRSNPRGYREWFVERMKLRKQNNGTVLICNARRGEVEDVPEYKMESPLQKLVKLLKRHRDVRYSGDEDKPISIIITTLAACAYQGEKDLVTAFYNVVPRMRSFIEKRNGRYWIANPVDPDENFADKWNETARKAELFYEWMNSVREEFENILNPEWKSNVSGHLQKTFAICNKKFAGKINEALEVRNVTAPFNSNLPIAVPRSRYLPVVAHQQRPPWPMVLQNRVSVSAVADGKNMASIPIRSDGAALPKNLTLYFRGTTSVPKPFCVYWQIVNTGEEAAAKGQLRGGFEKSQTAGVGGLIRREITFYKGKHWVICYIVKDGRCVARSDEFVVNIQ